MNPLRKLSEQFSAWNQKPRQQSAVEVAQLLHDVANNSADHGKVDGFIYIPINDPTLERIRDKFGAIYGPGFDPTSPTFTALVQEADAFAATAEEFLSEADPYGDRFGYSVPWWGCLLFVAALVILIYAIYRVLIWRGVAFSLSL